MENSDIDRHGQFVNSIVNFNRSSPITVNEIYHVRGLLTEN